mmetsp:Transcript_37088/g.56996  ORF Transcript_37088/g.56996 Transcript_37088/m.56996 type:complete len:110 (-) Transcript_37088:87-416(-)
MSNQVVLEAVAISSLADLLSRCRFMLVLLGSWLRLQTDTLRRRCVDQPDHGSNGSWLAVQRSRDKAREAPRSCGGFLHGGLGSFGRRDDNVHLRNLVLLLIKGESSERS